MANEIYHNYDEGNTLYAVVHKKADDKVFDENDGGDTFEAWSDANVGNYDIPMTDHDGDYYSVDFPAAIATAGVYRVTIFKQAAGSPHADNDLSIAQGEIYWDGTAEISIYTGSVDLTDIETKIDTIDSNVDDLIVDQNKVLNVIDETKIKPALQITVE